MTLKFAPDDAILKAIPNDSRKYSILFISDVLNVRGESSRASVPSTRAT